MRRPERGPPPELIDRTLARRGGHYGGGQSGLVVERWHETRDGPRQERLARAGGSNEQQTVATGEGDLEASASVDLPAHLPQIRHGTSGGFRRSRRRCLGLPDELDPWRR